MSLYGTIEIPVQYNSDATDNKDDRYTGRKYTSFEVVTKILEIILAVFVGGALVCVGVLQWGASSRQAAIAAEQNEMNRTVQRAYVMVSEIDMERVSGRWQFKPIIENNGTTPTEDASAIIIHPGNENIARPGINEEQRFLDWQLDAPPDPEDILSVISKAGINGVIVPRAMIAPKGKLLPFFAIERITDNEFSTRIVSNQMGRFFYGMINYTDVFNTPHLTKYCFSIGNFVTRETGIQPFITQCAHWNCVDKYCEKDKQAYEKARAKALANPRNPRPQ